MKKIRMIHTSDWHLGNTMNERSRDEENLAFLQWLHSKIVERDINVLVIAGDIFDTKMPSSTAQAMYYSFLAGLRNTNCRNIIVIGGNHDNASLLDAPKYLLEAFNISVIGSIKGRTNDDLVIKLKDENQEVFALVCAVPFIRESDLSQIHSGLRQSEVIQKLEIAHRDIYAQTATKALEIKNELGTNIPIIATGHLYSAGSIRSGNGEDGVREIVGTLDGFSSSIFPESFDYIALGHIHRCQKVSRQEHIRYCGSPFVMGFDETQIEHCILEVTFDDECTPQISKHEVPEHTKYIRLEDTLEGIREKLRKLKEEKCKALVDVHIIDAEYAMDFRKELAGVIGGANFDVVRFRIKSSEYENQLVGSEAVRDLSEFSEKDIFKAYIESSDQQENEEELMPLFLQLANEGTLELEKTEEIK
jgi:exonuclease SbcD